MPRASRWPRPLLHAIGLGIAYVASRRQRAACSCAVPARLVARRRRRAGGHLREAPMIPGEIITAPGDIEINAGRPPSRSPSPTPATGPSRSARTTISPRPTPALQFDRGKARGMPPRHPRRHGRALRARPDARGDARAVRRQARGLRLPAGGHGEAVMRARRCAPSLCIARARCDRCAGAALAHPPSILSERGREGDDRGSDGVPQDGGRGHRDEGRRRAAAHVCRQLRAHARLRQGRRQGRAHRLGAGRRSRDRDCAGHRSRHPRAGRLDGDRHGRQPDPSWPTARPTISAGPPSTCAWARAGRSPPARRRGCAEAK